MTTDTPTNTGVRKVANLSDGQYLLWLLELERGGNGVMNSPFTYILRGPLDLKALRAAFDRLVDRHEGLRTSFFYESSGIKQAVYDRTAPVRIALHDASKHEDPEAVARAHMWKRLKLGIEATADVPFTADVYRLAPDVFILSMNINHLIIDGWSKMLVCRDLGAFYTEAAGGAAAELPPVVWQFLDYVHWHAERFAGPQRNAAAEFWRQTLLDAPKLELRPAPQRTTGEPAPVGNLRFTIPNELADRLRALAKNERASLFMVNLALFFGVLHMASGERDISVGSILANRPRRELEATVGAFMNVVVLRARMPRESAVTFRDTLRAAREAVLNMLPFQDMSHTTLLADSSMAEADVGRASEIVFHMLATPQDVLHPSEVRFGDLEVEYERTPDGMGTRTDLEMLIAPNPEGLEGIFRYVTDRYSPEFIRRMADTYAKLAEAVVADPAHELTRMEDPGD